jgi:lipoprotein NlpD
VRVRLAGLLIPLLGACTAPRPTWVPPEEAQEVPSSPGGRHAPIPLSAGGGDARRARVHVVQEGETLYSIARASGVDPDELADLNQIGDPRRMSVGRELVLPGPPPKAPPAVAQAHPPPARLGPPPAGPEPKLRWPVQGVLYSKFGAREDGRHDGIDIAAPEGTPIAAAAEGRVIYAGVQRGYGNIVILRHAGGLVTLYAHNQENAVAEGEQVREGQVIARVGRTGRATGPHCHFEVRDGVTPRDPLSYLPR